MFGTFNPSMYIIETISHVSLNGLDIVIKKIQKESHYFHRYSFVRNHLREHGMDYPGPELVNDIDLNILHGKESALHSHECRRKYSPIQFERKSSKLPIEKENILDESHNDEEFEGVKIVNNIVYLED